MPTEHSTISDPEVHEPKGITASASGQVYVADGAASGDWKYQAPTNTVYVESSSDFPTPSAGVITLAANTVYHVTGQVDIGSDRIVMSNLSVLRGYNQDYDEVVSSTTGVLITQTDVNARIIQIKLTCASGTLLDVDGTGTESSDWLRVQAVCDTIGDFDNMSNVDIFRSSFDATTAGMTLTGAFTDFEITQSKVDVAATNGTCIDLGTATFANIHLNDVEFVNPTGTGFGLDVAAAGGNINSGKVGHIVACDFTNTSNASNYVAGDDQWIITGTRGVASSLAKAQGYVDGNVNTNTFGGGVGADEVVNFGTSFTADIQDKFTITTAGRITYTGEIDITVFATAAARVTMGGGAARVRNLKFAKNGTVIESSISSKSLDGTNEGSYSVNSVIDLTTSDYVELWIEAETATTTTTVDTASICVAQISG